MFITNSQSEAGAFSGRALTWVLGAEGRQSSVFPKPVVLRVEKQGSLLGHRTPESQGRGGENQGDLRVAGSLDNMSNGWGDEGDKTTVLYCKKQNRGAGVLPS